MDLAAEWAGVEVAAMCEANEWCRTRLRRHWPAVPIFERDEDVTADALRAVGIRGIDIVFGGPPCQPFSVAGVRRQEADERHRWPVMAGIVAALRPAFVVVENVAGFKDVAERAVRRDLSSLGYAAARYHIPVDCLGGTMVSERVFVVGAADSSRELQPKGSIAEQRRRDVYAAPEVEAVASADGLGSQARQRSAGRSCATLAAHSECGQHDNGNGGESRQSAMARATSRIADRLARTRWPAAQEGERNEWEPPPFADRVTDWAQEVKAIGNVCVPQQAYPIFEGIATLWRLRLPIQTVY